MLLPGAACFTRSLEFRTAVAAFPGRSELRPLPKRAIALRAIFARLVITGLVEFRSVKITRAVTRRAGIAAGVVRRTRIALLPWFGIAALRTAFGTIAKILAWTTVGRARREFLVAAKFSVGPIATMTVALTRRSRAVRAIPPRPVIILAKTFTARGVRPLFAATVVRPKRTLLTTTAARRAI